MEVQREMRGGAKGRVSLKEEHLKRLLEAFYVTD